MIDSAPTWVVRLRPMGYTTATPAAAIEHVWSTLPAGHIVTFVARY